MPKIVAFVEGEMERTFLNLNFKYVDVVTMFNGRDWTVDAMCDQLRSKYRIKNPNADLLVVWIDREKQACDHQQYEARLRNTLVEEGIDNDKIAVFMPDQMTENLILADERLIREKFGIEDYRYQSEGQNGKFVLKQMFRHHDTVYRETFHGVDLLKRCRVGRAALNSPSAARFYAGLPPECWWVAG